MGAFNLATDVAATLTFAMNLKLSFV
jgi:hypothetical protein